jgi:hypothetical protein
MTFPYEWETNAREAYNNKESINFVKPMKKKNIGKVDIYNFAHPLWISTSYPIR